MQIQHMHVSFGLYRTTHLLGEQHRSLIEGPRFKSQLYVLAMFSTGTPVLSHGPKTCIVKFIGDFLPLDLYLTFAPGLCDYVIDKQHVQDESPAFNLCSQEIDTTTP